MVDLDKVLVGFVDGNDLVQVDDDLILLNFAGTGCKRGTSVTCDTEANVQPVVSRQRLSLKQRAFPLILCIANLLRKHFYCLSLIPKPEQVSVRQNQIFPFTAKPPHKVIRRYHFTSEDNH